MVAPPGASEGPPPRGHFAALDALRGIAALVVAAEHLNAAGPLFGQPFFLNGMLFVDFFFVLSGFVIAASYGTRLRDGFPAARFLWLRVGRLLPVHLVVLGGYVLIECAVAVTGPGALTARDAFAAERAPWALLVQLLLLQSLYTPALYTWVLQSWSISVEMVLYVAAAWGWRRAGRWWWQASLLAALAAMAALAIPGVIEVHDKLVRGFAGFGLGVATYAAWARWGAGLARIPPAVASVIETLLVLAIVAGVQLATLLWSYALFDALFAVTVLAFAAERGALSALLRRAPFVFLGSVSYSIYMVHTLAESAVLSVAARLAAWAGHGGWFVAVPGNSRPAISGDLGLVADLASALVLALVVLAAWVMWRTVEDPARQWSRRKAAAWEQKREQPSLRAI